ncbi:MAG: hypothetical protein JWP61_89 [Friedmanniella sp.]|nr:hypothetical protein [Friedmanniella sp.]
MRPAPAPPRDSVLGRARRTPLLAAVLRPPVAAKVPEITVLFWVVKVLTTGMGEALSDYLAGVSVVLAAAVGLLGFGSALLLQLRTRRYLAPVYWAAVAMVAVFGTLAADAVHLVGLPYAASTAAYVVVLAATFVLWFRVEGTLSIHSILTSRRELFYWGTVMATFALGTAAGDLTARQLGLGYRDSAVLFGAAILLPLLAWRFLRLSPVVAFWAAYVLTRPLGASVADWLGKPPSKGAGLGYGDGAVALAATVVIVALVVVLARRERRAGAGTDPGSGAQRVVAGASASNR